MAVRSQGEGHSVGRLEHTDRVAGEQVRYISRRDQRTDRQVLPGERHRRVVRDLRKEQHQRW